MRYKIMMALVFANLGKFVDYFLPPYVAGFASFRAMLAKV